MIALSLTAALLVMLSGAANYLYDMALLKPWLLTDKWNPELTWKNKWKLTRALQPTPTSGRWQHWWYIGIYKPQYIERFTFSSTALVGFTDRWHAAQTMSNIGLIVGAAVLAALLQIEHSIFASIAWVILVTYFNRVAGFHICKRIVESRFDRNGWTKNVQK